MKVMNINKKLVSGMLALGMMIGTAVPYSQPMSAFGSTTLTASAATAVVFDINNTSTYKALTYAKVQQLYKAAYINTGSYNSSNRSTYYSSAPRSGSSWYEGSLSADTIKAVSNSINLYRTLAGLNTVTVSSNSTYQAGALLRSQRSFMAHKIDPNSATKPTGMSDALWKKAANCDNSDLAWSYTPSGAIIGWMDEAGNASTDRMSTAHRLNILDPRTKQMFFGYAEGCSLLYNQIGSGRSMKEAVSAYPSPGYMPTDLADMTYADQNKYWMAQLNSNMLSVKSVDKLSVKVSGGGESYTCTKANGKLRLNNLIFSNAIEFSRPAKKGLYNGEYKVEITGLTDVKTGSAATVRYTVDFVDITKAAPADYDISHAVLTPASSSCEYTGSAVKPSVTVKLNGSVLKNGTDYSVSYSSNINAGKATVTVKGIGKYKGTKTANFNIVQKDISTCTASLSQTQYYRDGSSKKPAVTVKRASTVLKNGTDYTVSYKNNVNAGTASAVITGKGNYKGTKTLTFSIREPINVKAADCTTGIYSAYSYTGKAITPKPSLKYKGKLLTEGVDYRITKYTDNTKVGTAYIHIKFTGKYSGAIKQKFLITKKIPLHSGDCKVTKVQNCKYTGKPVTPKIVLKYKGTVLTEGKDYTVTYENNINVGTAIAHIAGKGNYEGNMRYTFSIVK